MLLFNSSWQDDAVHKINNSRTFGFKKLEKDINIGPRQKDIQIEYVSWHNSWVLPLTHTALNASNKYDQWCQSWSRSSDEKNIFTFSVTPSNKRRGVGLITGFGPGNCQNFNSIENI